MVSTAGRACLQKNAPNMLHIITDRNTLFTTSGRGMQRNTKKKKSLLDKNKLGSQFPLFSMGEFSVGDPTAPGYSVFYPTNIQFLSAQKELNMLQ